MKKLEGNAGERDVESVERYHLLFNLLDEFTVWLYLIIGLKKTNTTGFVFFLFLGVKTI